ncbi:Smr/MutS family protein [Nonlabens ponticola]|uniref:DNA mismatch repair protein MutS n=1 Tax=Nonlabens ponticola TaxID=2496866 RepID=A0A3S9MXA7_9FLAO|nr:Smr/MutS family protein [Nonlabens ponticola]AZQ43772.1 DNA mismatch repair protein MutS [Nonlabens ponticola]
MSKFKKGDQVLVIDDDVSGVVAFAKAEQVTILSTDDIELQYHEQELILDQRFNVKGIVPMKKEVVKKSKRRIQSRKKAAFIPAVEVDLHIHQLTDKSQYMDNYDMLNLQIDTARDKIEWAKRERVPKLIFIHGVGEGVLKQELEFLLDRYEYLKYYDADYQKYGLGATEVYIYQNS